MADGSVKMDEERGNGNGTAVEAGKKMVDDSPIMRGGEAAKAADMANYFVSYAVRPVRGLVGWLVGWLPVALASSFISLIARSFSVLLAFWGCCACSTCTTRSRC